MEFPMQIRILMGGKLLFTRPPITSVQFLHQCFMAKAVKLWPTFGDVAIFYMSNLCIIVLWWVGNFCEKSDFFSVA